MDEQLKPDKKNNWGPILKLAGLVGGAIYAAGLAHIYLKQDTLLLHADGSFFPDDTEHSSFTLKQWRVDGEYRGLLAEPRIGDIAGTVLYFHGNSGHVSHRAYAIKPLTSLGYRVVLAEYPGFGRRAGQPKVADAVLAAAADFDLARSTWNGPLFVLGESFGAGVAAQIVGMNKSEVSGAALFTPWNSLAGLVKEKMWYLPTRLMLRHKMDSYAALAEFKRPLAIVAAGKDKLIPPAHARLLARSLPGSKLLELGDAQHSNWMEHFERSDWKALMEYLSASN
jgi:pimeloyl-ACP methyl ester carboxylesterase